MHKNEQDWDTDMQWYINIPILVHWSCLCLFLQSLQLSFTCLLQFFTGNSHYMFTISINIWPNNAIDPNNHICTKQCFTDSWWKNIISNHIVADKKVYRVSLQELRMVWLCCSANIINWVKYIIMLKIQQPIKYSCDTLVHISPKSFSVLIVDWAVY